MSNDKTWTAQEATTATSQQIHSTAVANRKQQVVCDDQQHA
jgi:hypothetical protein